MFEFGDRQYKADISYSGSGDNTIVAAPSAGRIVIDFITFIPTGATIIQFKDGATAFGGVLDLSAHQLVTLENTTHQREGLIGCTIGNAFKMNSTQATSTGGFVKYRIIDTP